MWAYPICVRQFVNDLFARITTFAVRVSETAATRAALNIENEVIARTRRNTHWHGIQSQCVTRFPCNYMVSAGRIAANTERSHNFSVFVIKGKPASENDNAAD
jgi:hypothetical protein